MQAQFVTIPFLIIYLLFINIEATATVKLAPLVMIDLLHLKVNLQFGVAICSETVMGISACHCNRGIVLRSTNVHILAGPGQLW